MNLRSGQQGFTLIELIMVIVIGGILAMGVTSFITHSVGGYVDTARRQALGGAGMVAAEKLARAARNALPNSIRVSGNCLELIPVLAGSSYVSAPVTTAASSFQVAAYSATQSVEGRVAIYPINVAALYSPGTTTSLSSAVATLPAGSDEVTLSFGTASHRFPTDSPNRRFFMVGTPVAYCQNGSRIVQFSNYGFVANLANLAAELAKPSTTRALLVDRVAADSLSWNYLPATLQRNAMVRVSFQLQDPQVPSETVDIEQEIQIRNVP